MKFEIVDFYPNKKQEPNELRGTLHIYIIDWDLDVRGLTLLKKGKHYWRVGMPMLQGWDKDEKKMVNYPSFNFMSKEKQRQFIRELRSAAIDFVTKNFLKK